MSSTAWPAARRRPAPGRPRPARGAVRLPRRPGDTTLEELAAALRRRDPAVHFLLSIREDALAQPRPLRRARAGPRRPPAAPRASRPRAGARGDPAPLERWNRDRRGPGEEVEIEPALVEAVLDQVDGQVALNDRRRRSPLATETAAGIEAPYLQLVLDPPLGRGAAGRIAALRLQTLERLGGADRIVRTHLDTALARASRPRARPRRPHVPLPRHALGDEDRTPDRRPRRLRRGTPGAARAARRTPRRRRRGSCRRQATTATRSTTMRSPARSSTGNSAGTNATDDAANDAGSSS